MKKNVIKKILTIVLIILIFQAIIYKVTATSGGTDFEWGSQMNKIIGGTGNNEVIDPIDNVAGTLVTVTQVISVGVAIIMLIVLGMKYMMSAPGDRATIKKHAVVYIVGAVIMFGAAGLLEIIRRFATVISANGSGAGGAENPGIDPSGGNPGVAV